jgi:hypothetical protein
VELVGDDCTDSAEPVGVLNALQFRQRAPGKAGHLRCAVTRCHPLQNALENIDQLIRLRRCAKRMSGKRKKGMFRQPVHEIVPRGRVRGGFAFADAGRPAVFLVYLLIHLVTDCQVTMPGHALSRGHERC